MVHRLPQPKQPGPVLRGQDHPVPRQFGAEHATHSELAAQVQYLKIENEILRSKLPKRVTVTPAERTRLVKFGKKVGGAIRELITIVTPRTFARWVSGEATKSSTTPSLCATPKAGFRAKSSRIYLTGKQALNREFARDVNGAGISG